MRSILLDRLVSH